MTAERHGLDLAAVLAEHCCIYLEGAPIRRPLCDSDYHYDYEEWPCLPYRLAALALDLQGKVARALEACDHPSGVWPFGITRVRAALADPTPTATCPKVTPFKAYTEETCSRSEGHAGGCLFTSHDGRTPLEVMPK